MSLVERLESIAREKRARIARLGFRDASAWLGPPAGFPLAREADLPRLRALLGEFGIEGALVSHWSGLTVSPEHGNRALFAALEGAAGAGGPRLLGVATGVPLLPAPAGGGPPAPLPGVAADHPLLAGVRLFPRSHNFPLAAWMVGGLCDWLVERRLPLFVWHEETDWPALHALASAFPALPIVVETQARKILYHSRPLFGLLRACPGVRVETSNLVGADFLAYAARSFGARRLLFGSFLPVNDPLAAMGMLLDAELPEEEVRRIAGGNLLELVEGRSLMAGGTGAVPSSELRATSALPGAGRFPLLAQNTRSV